MGSIISNQTSIPLSHYQVTLSVRNQCQNTFEQKRIYSFESQENNVTSKERFLILSQTILPILQKKALNLHLELDFNEKDLQYILKRSNQNASEQTFAVFYLYLINYLSRVFVIKIHEQSCFDSAIEALKLLNKSIVKKIILYELNLNNLFAENFRNQQNNFEIELVLECKNVCDPINLEKQMNHMIQEIKQMKEFKMSQELYIQNYMDYEIDNQIRNIQTNWQNVDIKYNKYTDKFTQLDISYVIFASECNIQDIKYQLIQQTKNSFKYFELLIIQEEQINLWNLYLSSIFKKVDPDQITFKENYQEEKIEVQIHGQGLKISDLKSEIEKKLKQYKCQEFEIGNEKKLEIFEFLATQECQSFFKVSLDDIQSTFAYIKIIIEGFFIRNGQGCLKGKIINNESIASFESIKIALTDQFLARFEISQTLFSLNDILGWLNILSLEQFQEKYEVFVLNSNPITKFLGLDRKISNLRRDIHNFYFKKIGNFEYEFIIKHQNSQFSILEDFIYTSQSMLQGNKQRAKESFCYIDINYEKRSFEIFLQKELCFHKEQIQMNFLDEIIQDFSRIMFIKYELKKTKELSIKYRLFKSQKILQKIKKKFCISNLTVLNLFDTDLSQLRCQEHNEEINELLNHNFLIFAMPYKKQQDVEEFNKEFLVYIDSLIVCVQEQDQLSIIGNETYDIFRSIQEVQDKFRQYEIIYSFLEGTEKSNLSLTYLTWVPQKEQNQVTFQDVKKAVKDVFFFLEIQLTDPQQIFIWNGVLQSKFERSFKQQKILTTNKENLTILELYGQEHKINFIKNEIEKDLKKYKCQEFILYSSIDIQIYKLLKQQDCKILFKKSLQIIQNSFYYTTIIALKLEIQNDQGFLSGKVINDEYLTSLELVKMVIKDSFLEQLELYRTNIDIKDIINLLDIDYIEQFEKVYEIFVHLEENQTILIGLKENIQKVCVFIRQLEKKRDQELVKGSVLLKNGMIEKKIRQLIHQQEISKPKKTKITYDENYRMIVVSEKKKIQQFLQEVTQIVQDLEQKIVIQDYQFNQSFIECLIFLKKEIEEIEKNKICQIQQMIEFQQQHGTQVITNKYYIRITSFSQQVNEDVEKMLRYLMENKQQEEMTITVPNFFSEDLEQFKFHLQNKEIVIEGQIAGLSEVKLKFLKQQEYELKQEISFQQHLNAQYPKTWSKQDKNMIKVQLSTLDFEYQVIEKQFQVTDKGQIHRIYRIQNKILWENYFNERKKIQYLIQNSGKSLTSLEQERYLWHGVKQQHPRIIYENEKEAFDHTYSNQGMWGNGIYFAENASYSRNYSFKLNGTEDSDLQGKLVFLCCLVTTGKLEQKQPDSNIKRPSKGYDCITGYTNGSNIFILYGMDVRRAYPAYEVIYS